MSAFVDTFTSRAASDQRQDSAHPRMTKRRPSPEGDDERYVVRQELSRPPIEDLQVWMRR